jgi:hypothetical protein
VATSCTSPQRSGERGAHRLAGEDQVARARRTDGAGEARGCRDVGQDAEGDLGQGGEHAVGGRQAQVAGERQLERHAHAGTVQHRHRRAMHALEAIEDRLQVAVQVRERRAAALLEDLEQEPVVDAAREHRAAAAQHQDARRGVVAHGVEGLGEARAWWRRRGRCASRDGRARRWRPRRCARRETGDEDMRGS